MRYAYSGIHTYTFVYTCNMHARKHTIAATSAQILHRAKTEEQGQLLLEAVALTDAWKDGCVEGVRKFWNSYCVPDEQGNDWYRWAMFASEGIPATTPNNNPIEAWHRHGVKEPLLGRLKGSTESVLNKSLPDVVKTYGAPPSNECRTHNIMWAAACNHTIICVPQQIHKNPCRLLYTHKTHVYLMHAYV